MSYWNYIPGAAAAVSGESFIFCVAGQTAGATLTQNNDKYDPDANTWTAKTALSLTARNLSTAVGIASEVYAQGGRAGTAQKDHAKYTLGTNAWSSLTDAAEINHGRSHGKMNGNYYMTGGNTQGSAIADVDIHKYLVSGDSWSDTGHNTNNIMANAGSGVANRDSTSAVWILLSAGPGTQGSTDGYTLATGAIAVLATLEGSWPWDATDARNAGFTAGGNLYVHNGWDADVGTGMSNKVREYSVSGDSWAAKTATNNSKVDIAGASLDADGDTGYSIGGSDEGYYGDLVERYSVSGNSWTNVTTLNYAPQHQTGASA